MTTDRKRVAAYLPDLVARHFQAFKSANDLSDSEAVVQILAAYFELNNSEVSPRSLLARVDRLERIIGNVEDF